MHVNTTFVWLEQWISKYESLCVISVIEISRNNIFNRRARFNMCESEISKRAAITKIRRARGATYVRETLYIERIWDGYVLEEYHRKIAFLISMKRAKILQLAACEFRQHSNRTDFKSKQLFKSFIISKIIQNKYIYISIKTIIYRIYIIFTDVWTMLSRVQFLPPLHFYKFCNFF